jgi:hypothetical protein
VLYGTGLAWARARAATQRESLLDILDKREDVDSSAMSYSVREKKEDLFDKKV